MKTKRHKLSTIIPVSLLALSCTATSVWAERENSGEHSDDILYVGDAPAGRAPRPGIPDAEESPPRSFPFGVFPEKNAVKRFDAHTGKFLDSHRPSQAFIFTDDCSASAPLSGSVCGPGRILFRDDSLYLGNGNINRNSYYDTRFISADISGEMLRFGPDGKPQRVLVPAVKSSGSGFVDNLNAPHIPTGMVLYKNILYVGDLATKNTPEEIARNALCDPFVDETVCHPGEIIKYNAQTGARLGSLGLPAPSILPLDSFHPRGIVLGPDGKLYIAVRDLPANCGGHILQYDLKTNTYARFIDSTDACASAVPDPTSNHLHRPDEIAFGPDGNLYVASFRKNGGDVDRILKFSGPNSTHPGTLLDSIVLNVLGQPRAFAQGLAFGPGDRLFVPVSFVPFNFINEDRVGEIRAYNVRSKDCRVFVPSWKHGGPLSGPMFLSFANTDPATHAYRGEKDKSHNNLAFLSMPSCE